MYATLKSSWKTGSVALALACGCGLAVAADPVREPFDRMLSHEPVPLAAPDPVAASFARMLAHQPGPAASAVPADAGTDPLIAAVVLPLLRANQFPAAGVAPLARH